MRPPHCAATNQQTLVGLSVAEMLRFQILEVFEKENSISCLPPLLRAAATVLIASVEREREKEQLNASRDPHRPTSVAAVAAQRLTGTELGGCRETLTE